MPEPMFAAEQIKVPAAFPDVLKEYSKYVIKNQIPAEKLLAASAEYFKNLSDTKAATPANQLSELQLESLLARLQAVLPQTTVSVDELKSAAEQSQIPKQRVDDILSLGGWTGTVPWRKFWALCVASATNSLCAATDLAITVLAADNSAVQVEAVREVYTFLAERDPSAGSASVAAVQKALTTAEETMRRDELIQLVHDAAAGKQ